ncbi:PQQ-binding-like beta-propeller repeat protein [Nibrella viscosa]|uniref:PQQ-binding-like beta-propeller repeat protein n=1 Tax=Nibrella viscosa TaxID=1084524 RepID=A0ABP8KL09_9BACT
MITQPTAESPFKFLDAYTAQDTDRFFGRDAEQQRLVELLFRSRLVLVYGQSGTGKTSLVQCGLAKAVSATDYYPVLVRRRSHVLTSLHTTLTGILDEHDTSDVVELVDRLGLYSMRPVYLIFDQLEELFVSGDTDEQQQFFAVLRRIYQASSGCKLLLVMREDYIAYLYPYEDVIPGLFDFRLRVEPMSERGLQAVITGTCRQSGRIRLQDETETVRQIIRNNQGAAQTFQLPYLQVYLDRLWRTAQAAQPGETVVFNPGLVAQVGAIDDVLEQFLNEQVQLIGTELPLVDTATVKRVLEAFVTYEGTRREHRISSLASATGLEPSLLALLLAHLERSRILSGEDGLYELAHDSLARLIDKGRSAEQRQINDILRRLKEAYAEYLEKDRAADLLLSARRVAEVQLFQDPIQAELARSVPDSEAIWQFVIDSQDELQRRQRREIRRLRTTIAIVSGLCILAVVAAVLAVREWEKSNVKSVVLQLKDMDPRSALAMSAWAYEQQPTLATAGALSNTFYNQRQFTAVLTGVPVKTAELSPDGSLVIAVAGNNRVYLWDWQGQQLADSLQFSEPVLSVSVAPRADHLVAVTEPGALWVWHRPSRQKTAIAPGLIIRGAAISADGQTIIGVTDDEQVHRWVRQGRRWSDQGSISARTAGFAPDGKTMLSLTADGNTTVWNTTTGQAVRRVKASVSFASEAISPTARQVLLTTKDSKVYLLDAGTGTQRWLPQTGPALGSGFAPDGNTIWTATEDSLHLWDTSGAGITRLKLLAPFRQISLSPDGQTLLLVYQNNKVHLLNREGLRLDYLSHAAPVKVALFAPDGQHILTQTEDGKAYRWGRTDVRFTKLEPRQRPERVELSPDGKQALLVTSTGNLQVWDLTQQQWDSLPGLYPIRWATFAPDGLHLYAVSDTDGKTSQWSLREKRLVRPLPLPPLRSIELNRDGQSVLAELEGTEDVWYGSLTGKRRALLTASAGIRTARFSPEGDYIVATGENTGYVFDRKGALIDSLVSPEAIRSAEISPGGQTVLLTTYLPTMYIWTPKTRRVLTVTDQDVVKTAMFVADGERIQTMTNRGIITIRDRSGQAIARVEEPYSRVWASGDKLLLQNGNYVLVAPAPALVGSWYRQTFTDEQRRNRQEAAAQTYSLTTSLRQALKPYWNKLIFGTE